MIIEISYGLELLRTAVLIEKLSKTCFGISSKLGITSISKCKLQMLGSQKFVGFRLVGILA